MNRARNFTKHFGEGLETSHLVTSVPDSPTQLEGRLTSHGTMDTGPDVSLNFVFLFFRPAAYTIFVLCLFVVGGVGLFLHDNEKHQRAYSTHNNVRSYVPFSCGQSFFPSPCGTYSLVLPLSRTYSPVLPLSRTYSPVLPLSRTYSPVLPLSRTYSPVLPLSRTYSHMS